MLKALYILNNKMELSKENELLRYHKGKFVQTKQLCANWYGNWETQTYSKDCKLLRANDKLIVKSPNFWIEEESQKRWLVETVFPSQRWRKRTWIVRFEAKWRRLDGG